MAKFKFKKKYGQNFLTDDNIAEKIVTSIKPNEKDLIIEIGPGAGVLTKKLKRYNALILAYEIDEETQKYLTPLKDGNTIILYEDFMTSNVLETIKKYSYDKLYIVSNLPYYITTPILERVIDLKLNPEALVIMVQKEVGERFLAKTHTKNYGYMTVLLNYWFTISKITDVNRKSFNPQPNVDSMVVKLIKTEERNCNYEKFKEIIKNAFQFKRKTIYNNLKKYGKTKLEETLKKHGFTLQNRGEEIDLDTYIDLANSF